MAKLKNVWQHLWRKYGFKIFERFGLIQKSLSTIEKRSYEDRKTDVYSASLPAASSSCRRVAKVPHGQHCPAKKGRALGVKWNMPFCSRTPNNCKHKQIFQGSFSQKVHNQELHNLYPSPNIIRVIKSRKIRQEGHVARMEDKKFIQNFSRKT